MSQISTMMSNYAAYHKNTYNKLTHFIGVPLIVYSILIVLAWLKLNIGGFEICGAMIAFFAITLWYLQLDFWLALTQLPMGIVLLYFAERTAALPFGESLTYFLLSFIGGWIIQIIGHVFEGRKPALLDNFMQIFNAPLFLALEVLFLLGLRREMRLEIDQKLSTQKHGA